MALIKPLTLVEFGAANKSGRTALATLQPGPKPLTEEQPVSDNIGEPSDIRRRWV